LSVVKIELEKAANGDCEENTLYAGISAFMPKPQGCHSAAIVVKFLAILSQKRR
jgi:hypothetical protein